MSFVHMSVNDMSKVYLQNDKRYNYTTPKSFLEQIALYSKLLRFNVEDLTSKISRLENGLEKLKNTSSQVGSSAADLMPRSCGFVGFKGETAYAALCF